MQQNHFIVNLLQIVSLSVIKPKFFPAWSKSGELMGHSIQGIIAEVQRGIFFEGSVVIAKGKISKINMGNQVSENDLLSSPGPFIFPPYIDAHIHPESFVGSLRALLDVAFSHGTLGLIADTHEAGNVAGVRGVKYFLHQARELPGYLHFGAPSCVPATGMTISGATIDAAQVRELLLHGNCTHLAEMMNAPGVLARDPVVMEKLAVALAAGVPIDGHVPHLTGTELQNYITTGIDTCHETSTLAHGREKIGLGMKVIIRWGSAVNNLNILYPLLLESPEMCMFCTDDPRASFLVDGHINRMVQFAWQNGVPLISALRAASLNPVKHFQMKMGLLQFGDNADFVIYQNAESLRNMRPDELYSCGKLLYHSGQSSVPWVPPALDNHYVPRHLNLRDLQVKHQPGKPIRVIVLVPGQLTTREEHRWPLVKNELLVADNKRDLLKLVVISRYDTTTPPGIGFVRGFGFKHDHSAIGSSVGHDCHNKCIVGNDDRAIIRAHELIDRHRGALVAVCRGEVRVLPLPIYGLMSDLPAAEIVRRDRELTQFVQTTMGCPLKDPFNALSFLPLEVIGDLRITVGRDAQGLFDIAKFSYVPLFVD